MVLFTQRNKYYDKTIMGRGTAKIIEDPSQKMRDLSIFMKTQTGKDFEFNEKLVTIVSIIEIHVDEYTAKYRPIPGTISHEGK